ncbi:MAG: M1 family metallopeptidase [Bacteroidales bacterium]|nr:M1 family metallopeptidase [Bacteroidales bacterium]HQP03563.1 M1 family metallopeptidase [Bacteroidales bacterium]
MRKYYVLINILLVFINISNAQDYFQQEVNYKINVELDDKNHCLRGNIDIEYINNSPDTLSFIYFHLWPNAYKNNKTDFAKQQLLLRSKDFYNTDAVHRGYIDSLIFTSGTTGLHLQKTEKEDIALLILDKALQPGDTIMLNTPFFVKIPDSFSRFGHIGQSYQITQWYPKPAVYDKSGWHFMPYLDMGEFYSEFGKYDVSISLPEDYIVAATGNLITKQELEWLEDMAAYNSNQRSKPSKQRDNVKIKTIRFVENNIHDFAWFADRNFVVKSDTLRLNRSGRIVKCWSFATIKNASLWADAVDYVKEAVGYYSECVGDYPYNNCTAVDGALSAGGGMEYPGITVISSSTDKYSLERVIFHEVGHNWFYGMLASNERQYPWIDEGFNSFYEYRFFDQKYPEKNLAESFLGESINISGLNHIPHSFELTILYQYLESFGLSQAANTESEAFSPMNYWVMSYQVPVAVLKHLETYLGPEKFDDMMQEFFNNWMFKHPYPEDIRESFEKTTGKNLGWFFDELISSNQRFDYAIKTVEGDSVVIVNRSKVTAPVILCTDSSFLVVEGFTGTKNIAIHGNSLLLSIDPNCITTDFNKNNNYYNRNALFPKWEKTKIMMTGFFDIPGFNELNILPALGYNTSQKLLLGFIAHNSTIRLKPMEWMVMPLFSPFRTDNVNTAIAGSGKISFNIAGEDNFFRLISLTQTINKYSFDQHISDYDTTYNWISLRTSATIWLKKNHTKPYLDSYLEVSFNTAGILNEKLNRFINLNYTHSDYRIVNPYVFSFHAEQGPGYIKAWSQFCYTISYPKKNRGLSMRLFGGKFLYNSTEYFGNFNFRLSGDLGLQDYQFQDVYTGRGNDLRDNSSDFWAHQFHRNGGGFVSYTPLGQTNDWLIAVNISANLPIPVLKIFVNAATWSGIREFEYSGYMSWETGLELEVIKSIFSIYLPVLVSKDIQKTNTIYFDNYFERIRFTLNLNLLNPYNYRYKISYLI